MDIVSRSLDRFAVLLFPRRKDRIAYVQNRISYAQKVEPWSTLNTFTVPLIYRPVRFIWGNKIPFPGHPKQNKSASLSFLSLLNIEPFPYLRIRKQSKCFGYRLRGESVFRKQQRNGHPSHLYAVEIA